MKYWDVEMVCHHVVLFAGEAFPKKGKHAYCTRCEAWKVVDVIRENLTERERRQKSREQRKESFGDMPVLRSGGRGRPGAVFRVADPDERVAYHHRSRYSGVDGSRNLEG